VRYRALGSSDLTVSEIGLGSWLTYSGGVSREQAVACVDRAFEVGITFVDTANVYGRGAAEELLGDVLSGRPRDSYVLATKVHGAMSTTDRGLSREQIHKQIDASLRRLRTDFVDLYQCHRYDPETPLEETMGALTEVVRAGKARWLGFSEWTPAQIRAALALPDVERFVSSQPEYSLLQRRIEAEVIPLCEAEGISQVVWSPLAQGALTGKYRPGEAPPADSRAASSSMGGFVGRFLRDDVLEAVQRLGAVAAGIGVTTAQLALAWVLRQPNVASAIVGASRPEQVEQNAAASGVELDEATLEEIELAFAGLAGSRA
jgi:aryl-alcohol dehydrogenase-like predicted oxidoreductase